MIETIVHPIQGPFIQVLVFTVLTILAVILLRPQNADKAWSIAGVVFCGFMVMNSVLFGLATEVWSYFFYSLGFSILYLFAMAVLLPVLIKGLNLQGSGESAMVFIIIIYHPVLLLVVLFLKWLYVQCF